MPAHSRISRSPLLPFCAVAWLLCFPAPARAPHEPGHPLRVVVSAGAGGATDTIARIVSERVGATLNVPVIVDNRPGASGSVAVQFVKDAKPDGGTVLITVSAPLTLGPLTQARIGYDPDRDLKPVTQVATVDFGLAVNADAPFKTIRELVAQAKGKPGDITYAVPGIGTPQHLVGVTFANDAGINLKPVPFSGSALAVKSLGDGSVPVALARIDDLAALHGTGRIRILALSGARRSPLLPDVPTLREANYNVVVTDWYGIFAPAGTPDAMVERLNKAVVSAVQSGEIRERLAKIGLQPTGTTPAELAQIQKADVQFWRSALQAAGLAAR